jgi:hypothetical protein
MGTRLVIVFAVLGAAGCGSRDGRAFTSVDPWYSPPPDAAKYVPLGNHRFAPVVGALQPEAQAALAEAPAKRVSADEAARLAGRRLPAGGEYVLLRAVVLNEETGGFEVEVSGQAVHIHHGYLGRHPVPMTRKAVVAVLPSVPKKVYVSCSRAE